MPDSINRSAEAPAFARAVLDVIRKIPPAKVMTYGDIAEFLERGRPVRSGRCWPDTARR